MKKIDIHIHTRLNRFKEINRFSGDTFASPEEIREMYNSIGVEKGILLPEIQNECSFAVQSNEEALALSQDYPDTFLWFCNLSPRMGNNSSTTDFSYFLNHYKALGAKGVGELTANLPFDDPLMDNLLHHCAECDMPVTIHIAPKMYDFYGIVDDIGLHGLEKTLKKYPKLKILGHSQPFWAEMSANVTAENRNDYPKGKVIPGRLHELMREYENLYGDMSAGSGYNAFSRDTDNAYRFIEEFSDKLMFATDICAPTNERPLSKWLDEAYENKCISKSAYEKICRENAIRILDLKI